MESFSSARDPDRARAHLNLAQDAIKKQVLQQQEKIRRLQDALVTKKDIIDDCQSLFSGPLRSVFVTGGGPTTGVSSTSLHSENELELYKRVRDKRRRKIMDRLVPIVGDTVAQTFQNGINTPTDADNDSGQLDIWDCTAGWVTSKSRTILWMGTKCRNKSKVTLRNISLSVALQETSGIVISSLAPQARCELTSFFQVDLMSLSDVEYTNRDQATRRILSNSVQVHYTSHQIGETTGGVEDQVSPVLVPISMLDISIENEVPNRWVHDLVNITLPARLRMALGLYKMSSW
ncbi:hypothetical protein EMPS_09758 [Entomortierella parvispora]|uniref:Uncharacterized protein n=1 Tax=Entomortierella parvispora TaxID=205924 RepID=A0A9P3HIL9_9FUNG|nr:hypothetical protein EMPS_09758 [Entomortierella parvispora]